MKLKSTDIGEIFKLNTTDKNKLFLHGGKRVKNENIHAELNKKPLVTIITVVKNGEKFIHETFESIFKQSYKNFEYIVIDGGSSDETINKIKQNEDKIDYWISESDDGIYDAFNKGLTLARGELIGFCNSDDVLLPNALEILFKYYNENIDKDFFFGSVKKHWGVLHGYRPWKIYWSWGFYSSHSTGFFIKKNSAKKNGFYNLKYKHSSDYDYFYRMIVKNKMKGVATKKNEIFGIFRRGGYSSKISFFDHFIEEITIRLDNGQNRLLVLFIFIYKFLKHFRKI